MIYLKLIFLNFYSLCNFDFNFSVDPKFENSHLFQGEVYQILPL